jgi:hypothetical protein
VALGASQRRLAGGLWSVRPTLLEVARGSHADTLSGGNEGRLLVLPRRDLTGRWSALTATATGDGSGAPWCSCSGGGRAGYRRAAERARSWPGPRSGPRGPAPGCIFMGVVVRSQGLWGTSGQLHGGCVRRVLPPPPCCHLASAFFVCAPCPVKVVPFA